MRINLSLTQTIAWYTCWMKTWNCKTQLKRVSSTGTASASSQSSLEGDYETAGTGVVGTEQVVNI